MVNGVLDKVAKEVRAAEFGLTASHAEAAVVSETAADTPAEDPS